MIWILLKYILYYVVLLGISCPHGRGGGNCFVGAGCCILMWIVATWTCKLVSLLFEILTNHWLSFRCRCWKHYINDQTFPFLFLRCWLFLLELCWRSKSCLYVLIWYVGVTILLSKMNVSKFFKIAAWTLKPVYLTYYIMLGPINSLYNLI